MILTETNLPKEIKLFEGEKVLFTYRRKYLSFLIPLFIGAIIVMGIIFAVYFAYMIRSSEFVNMVGLLLILIISIIFILAATLGKLYTNSHRFYVSNERIIIFKKFVSIAIRDVWFDRITDFVVDQGPIGRINNYGTIAPITAGIEVAGLAMAYLSLVGIQDPYKVREEILDVKQKIVKKE